MNSALNGVEKGTGPIWVIVLETLMGVSGRLSTSTIDVLLWAGPVLEDLGGDRSSR